MAGLLVDGARRLARAILADFRRYLEPPACAACRGGPLADDRIAWMGPHEQGWQVESDSLETATREIEEEPLLARLLGVPEVSADAAPPAGRLVLGKLAAFAPSEHAPWPGLPPRLQPAGQPSAFNAGTVFRYLGRVAGGWTFAAAEGRRLQAARDMVGLRDG